MTYQEWQLDNMIGGEAAREWEELNKVDFDPYPAAHKLDDALLTLYHVESLIEAAAEKVQDRPEEDKILSLLYEIEQVENAVSDIIHKDLGVNIVC